ncbi:30S ribosomal protein S16 [Candidatus Beckwithbacteria bacterium CG22_combo_CG10-13_8_21_14_all_01_47_9]|uniref:Small ribosomal subunit protein bS16 n=5 Tax=Candidatus Beckwithiibacteriota TaxID=1752726 RepID=A0A2H0E0U6_9BACT|nr:MAG: 30S ribosomal protein S16 [Candidatus Beckwithbacteria bacterium CG1_02_47_37]PIP51987.1 MAG: 30S ribosomal protein S16 [Candidatus Beckwithbacteria bacterium CG23_combo_of_CG06-09_8_20_14_all_47_9]PIP88044.1 MAG: 30S ribosomal protein S16 [Candidatus Beckwithbacteria bacterium CG22_combo_CG10-13_8_21_14_all_01_47_9]PJA23266.1 MAG: 30S ribosomal protein S16 [Candidatus Beckwithbacteria bacterium CG_4_10_14_0_2_um_filter_47_25]PJC66350.1 MAG: 30S ribosomal protein S16 [Candidatus Beckwit
MLRIKLQRIGKSGESHYRIVVAERRSKRDGKFVAQLGFYSPQTQPATIKVNQKLLAEWLAKGAQPTPTLKLLLKING